jgi:peptide/nickel transport system ATP-binding protein
LIPIDSGHIFYEGEDITGLRGRKLQALRKEMQIVFQDPYGSLNPRITIGEAITEVMKVQHLYSKSKERKEKAIALLEKVQLTAAYYDRYPHQLSGGQRQRICIARALACEPSFIVFDEAVAALDVSAQAQVLNLINDLKAEFGFSALFISHDLGVVRYISDKIMIMKAGKIVESGTPEEIFVNPNHPYTRSLLDAIPGKSLLQQ